jgi:Na+-transporting NADH:ubiquinone oxidoreductase subunit NqrF
LLESKLVSTGNVSIEINGDAANPIVVEAGSNYYKLLLIIIFF